MEENQNLYYEEHEKYCYLEVPQAIVLESALLKTMTDYIQNAAKENKKSLVCLAPNFQISDENFQNFFDFIEKNLLDYVFFVSKEGIRWGDNWKKLTKRPFWIANKDKAIRWTEEGVKLGYNTALISEVLYIKCLGNADFCIPAIGKLLDENLKDFFLDPQITIMPMLSLYKNIGVWHALSGFVIFDVAELPLDQTFCTDFLDMLRVHSLNLDAGNILFVTDGHFQTFLLQQRLNHPVQTASTIIRVLSSTTDTTGKNENIQQEVFHLQEVCQTLSPCPYLITLNVAGAQSALQAINLFYPDMVIIDELNDANFLQDSLHGDLRTKLANVIPATDPGVKILSPEIITKGYDLKLFAQYLVALYLHRHGHPNNTFFYYLNSDSKYLKKVNAFVMMEFSETLSEEYQDTLNIIATCETKADMQGYYIISVLQEKIIRLEVSLPFTNNGGIQFFERYDELFPNHYTGFCTPFKSLLQSQTNLTPVMKLDILQEFNDVFIQDEGISYEIRFQPGRSDVTMKVEPDIFLEEHCSKLFELLKDSEVFQELPDKELLFDSISLMWGNYKYLLDKNTDKQNGFIIHFSVSLHEAILKIYQNDNNRIFLETTAEGLISFQASLPYYTSITRNLLKIIARIFTQETSTANNWRMACFDAISQVTSHAFEQNIQIKFSTFGENCKAIFISDCPDATVIVPSSKNLYETGTEKFLIAENGRQIKLLIKPDEDDNELEAMPDLNAISENQILQEVQDEQRKEAEERSIRLQKIYGQALRAYNQKYGFDDDEEEIQPKNNQKIVNVPKKTIKGPKTIEEALTVRLIHSKESKAKEKVRRGLTISICVIVFICSLTYFILGYCIDINKNSQSIILREIDPSTVVEIPPVVQTSEPTEIPKDSAYGIVQYICNQLNREKTPTHDELNQYLKQLDKIKKMHTLSGDFFNLQCRLYIYKILIDQEEQIIRQERLNMWKQEAINCLNRAYENYRQQETKSAFYVATEPWRIERYYLENKNYISIMGAK